MHRPMFLGGIARSVVAMLAAIATPFRDPLSKDAPRVAEHAPKDRRGGRLAGRFQIGPNSHPRKVIRWLSRGGGSMVFSSADLEIAAASHVHPRWKRQAA